MELCVSDIDSDDTLNNLKKYVTIPIIKTTYENFLEMFEGIIQAKQEYWKALKEGNREKVQYYMKLLGLKKPKYNIQTIIFCDDASWIFNKNHPIIKHMNKTRHYQVSFWLNIHEWRAIPNEIRKLIDAVYICRGFSKEVLQHITRQISSGMNFNKIFQLYNSLEGYEKLFIDNQDQIVKIIS